MNRVCCVDTSSSLSALAAARNRARAAPGLLAPFSETILESPFADPAVRWSRYRLPGEDGRVQRSLACISQRSGGIP